MRTYTEVDTETLAERYWAKVEKGDGCWLWRGALNTWGYGSFWTGARAVGAHRWGYETFVGPIPDGMHLDHLCKVRHCVNPAHLEPVTIRENSLRGDRCLPTVCRNGHARTAQNTRIRPDGDRYCRECARVRDRSRRIERQEGER